MADYTYGNLDPRYVDAIRQFEGFTPQAKWDVRQNSNGYGTRARYPGEVIDKAEAERRLHEELTRAAGIVDSYASNLDPGTRAALASLTYNSGGDWMKSGLGQAVKAGDWDAARQSFGQYTKAGGQHLPGLAIRRNAELGWFGAGAGATQPAQGQPQPGPVQATYPFPAPMALGAPREPVQAPSEVLAQNYGSGTPQPSRAPQWDTGAFWAGKTAESKADGGSVPTADEILAEYSDPVGQFHHKLRDAPADVAPWDRPGTKSPVTGTVSTAVRPSDWAVRTGVAEGVASGVNPMVIGHGIGSVVGETAAALRAGDYGHAAGVTLPMAAMAVMPLGPKGGPRVLEPAAVKAIKRAENVPLSDKLVVQHNMTGDNLAFADRHFAGQLPVPSLGIAKAERPLEGFGEITLVGDPAMAKPSRSNPVFSGDAYSARFPDMSVKLHSIDRNALKRDIAPFAQGDEFGRFMEAVERYRPGDLIDSPALMRRYLHETGQPEFTVAGEADPWRVGRALQEKLRQDDGYRKWADEFIAPHALVPNSNLRINKGYSDTTGAPRYAPFTLDSVVKAMKGGADSEGFDYGMPNTRATLAPRFSKIDEIQSARDRIQPESQWKPESEAIQRDIEKYAMELLRAGAPKYPPKTSRDEFRYHSDAHQALHDALRGSERELHYLFDKDKLPPDTREWLQKTRNRIRELGTDYFEIKPQRAVGIGEFSGAVVPQKTPASVLDTLKRYGIERIEEYDGTPEGRASALQKYKDLMFAAPPAALVAGGLSSGDDTADVPKGFADGGAIPTPDEILAAYSDPVGQFHHKLLEQAPIVPPWDRPGTKSPVTGTLSNPPERPADWAVKSGVAETVSPTMGAYGVGSILGEVAGATKAGNLGEAGMNALPLGAMFLGPGAKTANKTNMLRAQEMHVKGLPREAIWKDTGWFQGVDGKWRYEIDDSKARLTDWDRHKHGASNVAWDATAREKSGVTKTPTGMNTEDFIEHPELAKAYWQLRDEAPAVFYDRLNGRRGQYEPHNDFVTMDLNTLQSPDGGRGTALHEYQHAVQKREGFGQGYNTSEAAKDIGQARLSQAELMSKIERYKSVASDEARGIMAKASRGDPEAARFVRDAQEKFEKTLGRQSDENPYGVTPDQAVHFELMERDEFLNRALAQYNKDFSIARMDPHELYKAHAGEVEARTVQKRMNMTPEERAARPPWLDYDVPESQQIVRYGDGGLQASASGQGKGGRPEPNALMPKAEAMGSPVASGNGSSSVAGRAGAELSVFDVADQVAKLIGEAEPRHHPTSFGNSSYVGGVRISDHPIGSGRAANGEISFSHLDGPEAIAQQIKQGREKQIAKMLSAPPPERKSWMSSRDWRDEQQRHANRRPGWLTPEEWSARKAEYAAAAEQPKGLGAYHGSPEKLSFDEFAEAARKGTIGPADRPDFQRIQRDPVPVRDDAPAGARDAQREFAERVQPEYAELVKKQQSGGLTSQDAARLQQIQAEAKELSSPVTGSVLYNIDQGLNFGYKPDDIAAFVVHNHLMRNDPSYKGIGSSFSDAAIKAAYDEMMAKSANHGRQSGGAAPLISIPSSYANGGAVHRALKVAEKSVNRTPSDAQKEAGNYAKGHLTYKGLNVTIENPKGSERSGMGRNGKRWSVKMPAAYGYVKSTEGYDGDHVDVYLGPDHDSDKVFVVDQINAETGKFDEHKCMLSYPSKDDALADYRKAFSDGKASDRIGAVTEMTMDRFKSWVKSPGTKVPLGDIRKGYADGGPVPTADEILSEYSDPVKQFHHKVTEGPPVVAPWDRPNTRSPVTGTLTTYERPADWAVKSGVAEMASQGINPMVMGHGLGSAIGEVAGAAKAGDYGHIAGIAAPMAAMAVVPMGPKGMKKPPALDSLGYYSGALESARNLPQAKGTPQQMLAMMQKGGAKAGEIEATGLGKWLEENYGSTTSTAPGGANAITVPSGMTIESKHPGQYDVRVNGKFAGTASVASDGTKPFISAIDLEPEFRRQGIGSALYGHIERDIGRKLVPSPLGLTPEATSFWQKRLAAMQPNERTSVVNESREIGRGYGIKDADIDNRLNALAQSNGERISGQAGTADRLKQNLVTRDDIANYLENNRVGLNEKKYGHSGAEVEFPNAPGEWHFMDTMADARDVVAEAGAGRIRESMRPAQGTKWSAYSLDPSNPTYRETVLHLPKQVETIQKQMDALSDAVNKPGGPKPGTPEWQASEAKFMSLAEQKYALQHDGDFQSGHFSEPNIVGHMMTSMTKHEGKPVYTIDQIQSDWGQKLRDGGVRDEAKAQRLKQQVDEKFADLSESSRRIGHPDSNTQPSLTERRALSPERFSELNRLMAEWRDAESGAVGHPLVNTTDQWTNTTLRRALQQAIDAKADHVAIPTGDTVLSYNPGDTAGMHGFYGRGPRQQVNVGADLEASPGAQSRAAMEGIVPKNLRKMLLNIDRDHPGGTYVNQLETPSGMKGQGFTMFPITPAVREYVKKNGLPLFTAAPVAAAIPGALNDPGEGFAGGGPVATPDEILAEYTVDRRMFG